MKITVIGDIHGHYTWEKIKEKEGPSSDRVIFLGDYVDSFHGKPEWHKDVLERVIEYKK